MAGKTLYDKLWDAHEVRRNDDGTSILYIDRHLLHEVTSAQAFEGLEEADRKPWRIDANLAVSDHNVPTTDRSGGIADPVSKLQVDTLDANCDKHKIVQFKMDDNRQGIVHVIGPACLAHGMGTSEVEHVLATQCLLQKKSKNMRIVVNGELDPGVSAKDLILGIIGKIGIAGGTGYAIEYSGEAISALSMEGRMTVCNMSVEAGSRAGMVAVDDKTIDYVKGRPFSPKGEMWDKAVAAWRNLVSDSDAVFDHEVVIDAATIVPHVSWGTSPEMVIGVHQRIPNPEQESDPFRREGMERALEYMGLEADLPMTDVMVDKIFIGSCTNGRIEDLRAAAAIVRGRKLADNIKLALVVPGSGLVKRQAEEEGLDTDFIEAGFEWREPGCSMCLAMNDDRLEPGERCASTSNRNFEGRQGHLSRTHLVGPEMAAACGIAGHFVDVREWLE
jgi:3-isopropylmalate/(R)-2-methylmalate dehydratase large subunit